MVPFFFFAYRRGLPSTFWDHFHSSVVPVFIVFPGVSSEGEDSSLLF